MIQCSSFSSYASSLTRTHGYRLLFAGVWIPDTFQPNIWTSFNRGKYQHNLRLLAHNSSKGNYSQVAEAFYTELTQGQYGFERWSMQRVWAWAPCYSEASKDDWLGRLEISVCLGSTCAFWRVNCPSRTGLVLCWYGFLGTSVCECRLTCTVRFWFYNRDKVQTVSATWKFRSDFYEVHDGS